MKKLNEQVKKSKSKVPEFWPLRVGRVLWSPSISLGLDTVLGSPQSHRQIF